MEVLLLPKRRKSLYSSVWNATNNNHYNNSMIKLGKFCKYFVFQFIMLISVIVFAASSVLMGFVTRIHFYIFLGILILRLFMCQQTAPVLQRCRPPSSVTNCTYRSADPMWWIPSHKVDLYCLEVRLQHYSSQKTPHQGIFPFHSNMGSASEQRTAWQPDVTAAAGRSAALVSLFAAGQ